MTLVITPRLKQQVEKAGEGAFPEECCGFLIGAVPEGFERQGRRLVVDEVRALPNGWEAGALTKTTRYQIDPKIFAQVERELDGTGKAIVGLYHSHPSVPAWPSPFDLERAWPCYSYWIVCVREGTARESRSWMRSEDGTSFHEEPFLVEEAAVAASEPKKETA